MDAVEKLLEKVEKRGEKKPLATGETPDVKDVKLPKQSKESIESIEITINPLKNKQKTITQTRSQRNGTCNHSLDTRCAF